MSVGTQANVVQDSPHRSLDSTLDRLADHFSDLDNIHERLSRMLERYRGPAPPALNEVKDAHVSPTGYGDRIQSGLDSNSEMSIQIKGLLVELEEIL